MLTGVEGGWAIKQNQCNDFGACEEYACSDFCDLMARTLNFQGASCIGIFPTDSNRGKFGGFHLEEQDFPEDSICKITDDFWKTNHFDQMGCVFNLDSANLRVSCS